MKADTFCFPQLMPPTKEKMTVIDEKAIFDTIFREITNIKHLFTVDTLSLKRITDHFVHQLENGTQSMNITWVPSFPTGLETEQTGDYRITQDEYRLPDKLKTGTAAELWELIADKLLDFFAKHKLPEEKGTTLPVEGEDVVSQFGAVLAKKDMPVHIVALVNDTVGALITSAYKNPDIRLGSIFGTGATRRIWRVNCEYGAFDNGHQVLPRAKFDLEIDETSARPGQQTYGKMVAGMYLGELLRLILLHLHESVGLFGNADIKRLRYSGKIDSSSLSMMEADGTETHRMAEAKKILQDTYGINATDEQLRVSCILAEIVYTRAARPYACGIAALCRKQQTSACSVGVDGSAFEKYSRFRERAGAALREILDWPKDQDLVKLVAAEDGSGIGAALIAAIILNR
ncbi:hexokinase-domain-containing protein [Aspergillus undulatus]|uniref:hexokinase-domain-containing protein n=1 Tax=Aspergillus undulatus TaxID=1810928 RepID=UPI003CCDE546